MIELLDMHDKRNIWLLILIMPMIMLLIMHDDIRTMICLLILAYDWLLLLLNVRAEPAVCTVIWLSNVLLNWVVPC